MLIYNIKWATDGEKVFLPAEVWLEDNVEDVAEKLSDMYGWLVDSFEFFTKDDFESKVYEAYKLQWMISHGFTIKDYLDALIEADEDATFNGTYPEGDTRDIYESLASTVEYDTGLGAGSMWVCKGEFLDAEFKDDAYMQGLISQMANSTRMLNFWRREYGKTLLPNLEIPTSAGVLKAYESGITGQPGICVMFTPAGFTEEIDLAYVSVYEDSEYQTGAKERPVDVVICAYGDPYSEDYTKKDIIRREDVMASLTDAGCVPDSQKM